jgi:hypothetical protein
MPEARGVAAPEVWTNSQVIRRCGHLYRGRFAPYTASQVGGQSFADEALYAHDPCARCDLRHSPIAMDRSLGSRVRMWAPCQFWLRRVAIPTLKQQGPHLGS